MHGHDTSPMGTVPVNLPCPSLETNFQTYDLCFYAQKQRQPMHPKLCCRRVIPRFPHCPAIRSALLGAQSKRSTHGQQARCLPTPPTLGQSTIQEPSPDTPWVRCRICALSRLSIWKQTLAKSYMLLFKVSQFVFILLATFTSCSELCLKLKGRGNVQQEKIIHW